MAGPEIGRSRLPELLAEKRMSQAEFAREIGVTEGFVSQVVKGEGYFSLQTAKKAANVFKCCIDDLHEWGNS